MANLLLGKSIDKVTRHARFNDLGEVVHAVTPTSIPGVILVETVRRGYVDSNGKTVNRGSLRDQDWISGKEYLFRLEEGVLTCIPPRTNLKFGKNVAYISGQETILGESHAQRGTARYFSEYEKTLLEAVA